jgi:hypothetical protein
MLLSSPVLDVKQPISVSSQEESVAVEEDETLFITLNDIKFTIIKKTNHADTNREVVKIKSLTNTGEKYTFWVYRSNSEMGLWRFCLYADSNIFYKGIDYIQTTLVHLELQKFINNNIDLVPYADTNYMYDAKRSDECYCINMNNKYTNCNIQKITSIINDEKRMIIEAPFAEMHANKTVIDCGLIPKELSSSELSANKFTSNILKKIVDFPVAENPDNQKFHSVNIESEGFKKKSDVNTVKLLELANFELDKNRLNFKGDMHSLNIVYKELIKQDIYDYMENFSKIFEAEFEYEEEQKLFEYDSVFEDIINVTNNIYSVKLTRKVQNPSMKTNEIILYFDVAYFKKTNYLSYTNLYKNNITNICTMPMHIFPFLLTTTASQINCLGLYSDYIFAGPYLCKLFDYSSEKYKQCTITEENEFKCTPQYSYIGKRYLNLFPLKQILENIQNKCKPNAVPDDEPGWGGRRTKKKKRRNKKRKQSKYKRQKHI